MTVSILEEQMALYSEPVSMHVTSFDGDRVRSQGGTAVASVVDADGHAVGASDWFHRYGS